MKQRISIWLLMGLLTGCMIAPGMSMRDLPGIAEPPPQVPGVKIMAISADLIRASELSDRRGEAKSDQEKLLPGVDSGTAGRYDYRIGVHDVLSVVVWDHPELTIPAGEFRSPELAGHLVSEEGVIFYPHVGTMKVAGKTAAEVRELIAQGLAKTIQNPQVDVRVAAFRSQKAYISGEVARPGPQPITDVPLTVAEAVGLAGDVTPNGDLAHVILTRDGKTRNINLWGLYDKGDTAQNVLLKNGDVLHVPDRNMQKVFVLGEVQTPSSIVMHRRGMTLTEAISDAGGVDRVSSNPAQIFVIRGTDKESEIYYLNAKSPDSLILGDHFRLKPRDVVYVETAAITRWNRVIEQIVPTSIFARNVGRITGPQ